MKKFVLLLAVIIILPLSLLANKTSVKVVAPDTAVAGETVKITIDVKHKGNSARHFTDWVYVKINGEEVKRWEFSRTDLPESQEFQLEYEFVAESTVQIEIKGNCNLHGSSGKVMKTITVN